MSRFPRMSSSCSGFSPIGEDRPTVDIPEGASARYVGLFCFSNFRSFLPYMRSVTQRLCFMHQVLSLLVC